MTTQYACPYCTTISAAFSYDTPQVKPTPVLVDLDSAGALAKHNEPKAFYGPVECPCSGEQPQDAEDMMSPPVLDTKITGALYPDEVDSVPYTFTWHNFPTPSTGFDKRNESRIRWPGTVYCPSIDGLIQFEDGKYLAFCNPWRGLVDVTDNTGKVVGQAVAPRDDIDGYRSFDTLEDALRALYQETVSYDSEESPDEDAGVLSSGDRLGAGDIFGGEDQEQEFFNAAGESFSDIRAARKSKDAADGIFGIDPASRLVLRETITEAVAAALAEDRAQRSWTKKKPRAGKKAPKKAPPKPKKAAAGVRSARQGTKARAKKRV